MANPGQVGEPLCGNGDDRSLTIGELARRHGLSRSTLLYYDRIGLLSPSARSSAGYRRYSTADAAKLAHIRRYRRAGLALDRIKDLLERPETDLGEVLGTRLADLNDEIRHLREQQRFIVASLRDGRSLAARPFLASQRFIELMKLAGIKRDQRAAWHMAFEQTAAEEHQAFLEFLCLPDTAITKIRERSRRPERPPGPR